ncbi:MAG: acyl carrier protein [Chloroflexota bacterium]
MNSLAAIRQFILDEIVRSPKLDLTPTDRLIDSGYLTSLDVVQLIVFLDEELGVTIDPEDVTEEHFQTLESIAALVDRACTRVS